MTHRTASTAFARFANTAPEVWRALPASDAPPLSPAAIAARVSFGAPSTVRQILALFARDGIAEAVPVTVRPLRSIPSRLYRRHATARRIFT